MKSELTKQDILELLEKQAKEFQERILESNRNIEKSRKEFHDRLLESEKSRKAESDRSRKDFEESLQKSRAEFDKRLGELGGTWGRFVAEMIRPRIVELFKERGIAVQSMVERVLGFRGDERYYEIDMLILNSDIAVAVEIKTTLEVNDVKDHLERLEKIRKVQPNRINLRGVKLLGAVAGMIIENDADRYAYKQGLFVLRQKGNVVEIVNDDKFVPREWEVEY